MADYATSQELREFLPGIEESRAQELVSLASKVIDAHTHLPIDTTNGVPKQVNLACLMIAARINQAQADGAAVTGESIMGYSVQYGQGVRSDVTLALSKDIKELLAPWRNTSMLADVLEGEYEARLEATAGGV